MILKTGDKQRECHRCGDDYPETILGGDSLECFFCNPCIDILQPERSKREDNRDCPCFKDTSLPCCHCGDSYWCGAL